MRCRGRGMRKVLAVYQKELGQYFRSPIAYFAVAVFLIGTGYFFTYNIFLTGIATMTETFQSMAILLLLVQPAVSMRLFAAEHEAGTMELLQTLPLQPWQLVLGKFLGAVAILLLMTLGSMIDLLPLYLFGHPETSTILSGYLGFLLLGMACLAAGQFFSSLTENQIVAALVTVSVLLAFWFIGHLESFQTSYVLRSLFAYLSFSADFAQFVIGLVRSEAVMFYGIVIATALTLNASYLEWRR
jgi:ABC-2 type transport system permease protein